MPRYRRRRSSQKRRTGGFNFGNFAKDLLAAAPSIINVGQGLYNSYKNNKTSGMYRRRRRPRTSGPPRRGPPRRRRTHGIYDMISRRNGGRF